MSLQDIVFDDTTAELLKASGRSDRANGIDKVVGWAQIAEACGYSNDRTPAREAYEDGYYETPE